MAGVGSRREQGRGGAKLRSAGPSLRTCWAEPSLWLPPTVSLGRAISPGLDHRGPEKPCPLKISVPSRDGMQSPP